MNFKEFIKNLKIRIFKKTKQLEEHNDKYPVYTESIDDIELIKEFERAIPKKLMDKVEEYKRKRCI